MKKIYTVMPTRLNLNGEQGNVLVIQRRLQWLGIPFETISLETLEDFFDAIPTMKNEADESFVFIGQGSLETFEQLQQNFTKLKTSIDQLSGSGVPTLIVGTCYEVLSGSKLRSAYFSEFVVEEFQPSRFDVLGYAATGYDLPALAVKGNSVVMSVMHGPILAKNPKLSDWFLNAMGISRTENANFSEVDEIAERIWSLERPK